MWGFGGSTPVESAKSKTILLNRVRQYSKRKAVFGLVTRFEHGHIHDGTGDGAVEVGNVKPSEVLD